MDTLFHGLYYFKSGILFFFESANHLREFIINSRYNLRLKYRKLNNLNDA